MVYFEHKARTGPRGMPPRRFERISWGSLAEYTIGQPDDFIRLVSEDYFQKEGFKLVPYKGEML